MSDPETSEAREAARAWAHGLLNGDCLNVDGRRVFRHSTTCNELTAERERALVAERETSRLRSLLTSLADDVCGVGPVGTADEDAARIGARVFALRREGERLRGALERIAIEVVDESGGHEYCRYCEVARPAFGHEEDCITAIARTAPADNGSTSAEERKTP